MLKNLIDAIPSGNKKHPLMFYRLNDTLDSRMSLAKNKFMLAAVPRTTYIETLRWILLNFNLDTAKSYTNDVTLYTEYIEASQDTYRSAFDPVYTKTLGKGKFIHGKGNLKPVEIYLNCSNASTVDYPFGEDWLAWQHLRSVIMIWHNSHELPIDMFTGYMEFKQKCPTLAVFSINVPLLLMKWYKYNVWCKASNKEADELTFLRDYEIGNMFYDLHRIWTTNLISTVLAHPEATTEKIVGELSVPKYLTSEIIVRNGVDALKEYIDLIKSRNMKLQDFIDTAWYSDNVSIRAVVLDILNATVLPDSRAYLWLDILKILPFLRMISAVIDLDQENPLYKNLMYKAYQLYVKNIKYAQLPSIMLMPEVKSYVSLACAEFEKLFAGKIQVPVEITTTELPQP